jgi:CRP/FNR family transcriptional regulator
MKDELSLRFTPSNTREFFFTLAPETFKNIEENSIDMHFKKGQSILKEYGNPIGLLIIKKGKVKIFKTDARGKIIIIGFLREGDIVGFYTLLNGGANIYSASAIEETNILIVPKTFAKSTLENNKDFLLAVNKQLMHKMVRMLQKISHIAFKSVRESIAMSIIELSETFETDKYGFIDVGLTKEEIGQLSSTTTSAAIKLTNEFQKDKIILIKDRKIKIMNREKLYKTADLYLPLKK